MENNICKFIPMHREDDVIHTINFVFETQVQLYEQPRFSSSYTIHFVTEGTGIFSMLGKQYSLKKGDIFFVFPAVFYEIQSIDQLKYYFIQYIGMRANRMMEEFRITKSSPYFENFSHLQDVWKEALDRSNLATIELFSESILLYTLAQIGRESSETYSKHDDLGLRLKKYIDEHFCDPTLTLEKISSAFSYHPKYLSTVFKNQLKLGFSQYLNVVRVQNACVLMEEGMTCVKDISFLCGFSDPLYFSKVFKQKMGVTPKEQVRSRT